MHDRTAWTRGEAGEVKIKNRIYKNLVEFTRNCSTCGKPFAIHVTANIADGKADSNSFGLKNCEEHRRNKPAGELAEIEALKMANKVMKEELEGLYVRDRELFSQNQELKARLAAYELGPAMEQLANGENNSEKFPWGS